MKGANVAMWGVVGVLAAACAAYAVQGLMEPRPDKDGCVPAEVENVTAIYADGSQPVTEHEVDQLVDRVEQIAKHIAPNERLMFFLMESGETGDHRLVSSACNRGAAKGAGGVWAARELAKFLAPIREALKGLATSSGGASPFIEGTQALLERHELMSVPNRRLILISDLLANGPTWSVYPGHPAYRPPDPKNPPPVSVHGDVRFDAVHLIQVTRPGSRTLQTPALRDTVIAYYARLSKTAPTYERF